ncbi:MAG: hypothetical protein ACFFDS_05290 [Candidatus Thorarchaeota archaeon]
MEEFEGSLGKTQDNKEKTETRRERRLRKREESRKKDMIFWESLGIKTKIVLYILGVPAGVGVIAFFIADFVEWDWQFAVAGFCLTIPFLIAYGIIRMRYARRKRELVPIEQTPSLLEPHYSPAKTTTLEGLDTVSKKIDIQSSNFVSNKQQEDIELQFTQLESVEKRFPVKIADRDLNENCAVCNSPILENETYIRCPYCSAPAHSDHMMKWLNQKSICPNCKSRIR